MQALSPRIANRGFPVRFRIGLRTGPLVAGVIGEKRYLYDVWGDTVNTASRLESHGEVGRIQVSVQVAERLQGGFRLTPRGQVELRGKGRIQTVSVQGASQGPAARERGVTGRAR